MVEEKEMRNFGTKQYQQQDRLTKNNHQKIFFFGLKINTLPKIFIFVLVIAALTSAQLNFVYQSSIGVSTIQATFHPTDNDLVAFACDQSPYIMLYNVSENTLNSIQNYSQSTVQDILGLKYSPVNGSRAVASFYINAFSMQLFTLTPQAIYSEYTLSTSNELHNLDISPSGAQSIVTVWSQLILYSIAQASINLLTSQNVDDNQCRGATFVNETIVFLTCSAGIYQFSIEQTTITQQTQFSLTQQQQLYGITFLRGSNTSGVYVVKTQNLDSFTYTYNGASSTMTYLEIFPEYNEDSSVTFSADNTRLIVACGNNITLYKTIYIAKCAIYNSSGICLLCNEATTHPSSTASTHAIVPVKLVLTPYPAIPVQHLHHLVSYHNFVLVQLPHLMMVQQQQVSINGQLSGNGQTSNGTPAWAIALLVVGCLIIVLILAALYCFKKYRIHAQQGPADLAEQERQYQIQYHQQQNRQQQQSQNQSEQNETTIQLQEYSQLQMKHQQQQLQQQQQQQQM